MTKCRQCLLFEMAGMDDVIAHVDKMRSLMPAKEKASDEQYAARLAKCKECKNLYDATCSKCGCYVEIRALASDARCPIELW